MKLEPLYPALNKAVEHIVDVLMPDGFDTTDNEEHCNTYRKLEGYHKATGGRIIVWTGASNRTIFGAPEINHAFRAWHDWCHLVLEADFSQAVSIKFVSCSNAKYAQCARVSYRRKR